MHGITNVTKTASENDVYFADIYAKLAAPFDSTFKDVRGGVELEYITGEQAITRLNEVLGVAGWSFRVLEHGHNQESDEFWVLAEMTAVKDPALYERMTMPGLNPDGEVNVESLREDYEFWLANGYQEERVTVTDLVDHSFVRYAVQQLGPYR